MSDGLHAKFHVERTDGRDQSGGDKADARYFVLDYVHDRYAREALAHYAFACEREFPRLAYELRIALEVTYAKGPADAFKGLVTPPRCRHCRSTLDVCPGGCSTGTGDRR